MTVTVNTERFSAHYPRHDITGVVLAGGRARRMGGEDKGLIRVDGEAMVVHALRGLAPQVQLYRLDPFDSPETRVQSCFVIIVHYEYDILIAGRILLEAYSRVMLFFRRDSPGARQSCADQVFCAALGLE